MITEERTSRFVWLTCSRGCLHHVDGPRPGTNREISSAARPPRVLTRKHTRCRRTTSSRSPSRRAICLTASPGGLPHRQACGGWPDRDLRVRADRSGKFPFMCNLTQTSAASRCRRADSPLILRRPPLSNFDCQPALRRSVLQRRMRVETDDCRFRRVLFLPPGSGSPGAAWR